MAFDPDAYLGNQSSTSTFDPNAYLASSPTPKMSPSQAFGVATDLAPWNVTRRNTIDALGEKVGTSGQGKWTVPAAALGALIQTAPDALALGSNFENLAESENPIAKGLMNTPKDLGPEYDELRQAAGVSTKSPEMATTTKFGSPYSNTLTTKPPRGIPVETNIQSNLVGAEPLPSSVPIKYASDPGTFRNYANARMDAFGEDLSPQEISDYGKIISNFYKTGTIPKDSPDFGQLSSRVTDLENQITPGMEDLNRSYQISKMASNPVSAILPTAAITVLKKYAPYVLEGLGWGAGSGVIRR